MTASAGDPPVIDDLQFELDDPSRPLARFRIAPAIPESPLVARAIAAALQKAIAKVTANKKADLVGRKLEIEGDRWVSVPVKGLTATETGVLEESRPLLIAHVNELGGGAARLAQRLNR